MLQATVDMEDHPMPDTDRGVSFQTLTSEQREQELDEKWEHRDSSAALPVARLTRHLDTRDGRRITEPLSLSVTCT